jgi:hypothetical protein
MVGWILTEISQGVRRREGSQAILGEALVELMEIRHRLNRRHAAEAAVTKLVAEAFGENEAALRPLISQVLNQAWPEMSYDPSLVARYDVAVTRVSGVNPILAFDLRGRDWAMALGARMRAWSKDDATAQVEVAPFSDLLLDNILPQLDEAILKLAHEIGRTTSKEAQSRLNARVDPPVAILNAARALFEKAAISAKTEMAPTPGGG